MAVCRVTCKVITSGCLLDVTGAAPAGKPTTTGGIAEKYLYATIGYFEHERL